MHTIRHLLPAALTLLSTTSICAQTTTREKVADATESLYDANLKNMQEYTCNMTLINLDRQNILDRMDGKTVPSSRYDSIIAKATECIATLPSPLAYDYRAKAYADKGDLKAALADFEKALALAKKDGSPVVSLDNIYEGRADLYIQFGDRARAEADLREAVKLNPSGYSAKDKLDNLDAKLAEARRKAAIAAPKTADDYVIVGEAYDRQGKYSEALAAYSKSISMKPSAAAYVGKAKTYRMMERYEAAVTEMNSALALTPKDVSALSLRGYILRDLKRWEASAADFDKALPLADARTKPDMLVGRGTAYAGLGKYDAALKDLDAALASPGIDVYSKINALTSKGDVLRGGGKPAEALAAYSAAIAVPGDDYIAKIQAISAYIERGRLYASQGKTELAKADFNAVLGMSPTSKEAKAELARLSTGGTAPATTKPATKTAEAWAAEGRRAASAKKWDEAVAAFNECIKLAPDSAGGYAFRGAVLGMKGDLPAARTDFDRALKLSKNNPAVVFMRAQMYMQLGRKPEAVSDFREVLRLMPGNAQATKALEMLGEKP